MLAAQRLDTVLSDDLIHDPCFDDRSLAVLFRDIVALGDIEDVMWKPSPLSRAESASLDLIEVHRALRSRTVCAVQIRYRRHGATWLDTVVRRGDGYRLLRTVAE